MKRRRFLQLSASVAGVVPVINACKPKRKITGSVIGASSAIGHMLRDKHFDTMPVSSGSADVVIVGGGVSGLSAAWWLQKAGLNDFVVMDLEKAVGGNSANGGNDVSAFPWGAHYVPVPNNDLSEYLSFLEDCNVITGKDTTGRPIYNDFYLCFDPQERLYINGLWQDGLVPQFGVPEKDSGQFASFFEKMDMLRAAKGNDGNDAFAIPLDRSSSDQIYTRLDSITMKEWMLQQHWDSEYLHWYVDYSTRDDFGTPADLISAWTGIHYFAARKGSGANATHNDVLTWPEGNGFLVNSLSKGYKDRCRNNCLVVKIKSRNNLVEIIYFDVNDKKIKGINCRQAIIATPQFVTSRLIEDQARAAIVHKYFSYCPWMVANLKVNELEERRGQPSSWDNVLYGSSSLGYVNATHQMVQQKSAYQNLTYYHPLTTSPASAARQAAQQKTHEQWLQEIFSDLKIVHPNIEEATVHADIMLWGHAMAQPLPGMAHGPIRRQLQESINNHIHFAHTDLAGISIFEEGFYQGLSAAGKVLKRITAS